jgi:hypothetical protein
VDVVSEATLGLQYNTGGNMPLFSVAAVYTIQSKSKRRKTPDTYLWHSMYYAETPEDAGNRLRDDFKLWNEEDKARGLNPRVITLGPTVLKAE